jgi:hypothetical protein
MAGKYGHESHQTHRPARRFAETNERLMKNRDQVEIWSAPTWLWRTSDQRSTRPDEDRKFRPCTCAATIFGRGFRVARGRWRFVWQFGFPIEMGKVHAGIKSKRRSRISIRYYAAPLTSFWFLVAKPPARVLSKDLGRLKGRSAETRLEAFHELLIIGRRWDRSRNSAGARDNWLPCPRRVRE